MKKTILICGLLVVGLALLSGCHTYSTRVAVGADYYAGYPPYPNAYGPYYPYAYDPYYAYAYDYPYYPYYYPYYPFFTFGFGFSNVFIDGTFVRGRRVIRSPGIVDGGGRRVIRGAPPGRSGGRVLRRDSR